MHKHTDIDKIFRRRGIKVPGTDKYEIDTAKLPKHVLPCPFCGSIPEVHIYENGKGAEVKCNTPDCALWHTSCDLADWNKRSVSGKVRQLLFNIDSLYVSSDFHKKQLYVCRGCGAAHYHMNKVRHSKRCCVKELLGDAP